VRIAAFIPFFDALVLIPFARLRMQRRPRAFALMRLAAIIVNVALNAVFVVMLGFHVEGVVLAGVASSAFSFLLFLPSLISSRRRDHENEGEKRRALFKDMVRFGLPTVPASFSSIMVQVIDRPLLLILTSSAVVGMYQTNFRLAIPMMMFITVFEYAWKPFYLTHRDDDDAKGLFARVLTWFTVVCGAIFLVTALFMPFVVQLPFIGGRFINPLYWDGMTIIPIIMFAYFFNGVFINMAAGLHITKKTGWLPLATGAAAIVNVVATLVLVPLWHIEGAAWAKVAAYVTGAIILAVYVQKVYPVSYEVGRIITTIVIAAAIYLGSQLPMDESWSLPFAIGALPVYVVCLVALGVIKTSTLRTILSRYRR
jgi:O-antigen/teichoic acid export membrane protein